MERRKLFSNCSVKDGTRWKFICCFISVAFLLGLFLQSNAQAFSLTVLDGKTKLPITGGYRWMVEEDATHHVIPGDPTTNWAIDFHKSYMPVVAKGTSADLTPLNNPAIINSTKHYFISVLPNGGYSLGGAPVAPGQTAVTVYVNQHPIPTAQISVFVFEDNFPINNAPDLPAERGLEGFSIILEDAGGRYGISAGVQTMDAFGNPLGTTYYADGSVATMGDGIIKTGPDGMASIKNLAPGKYGIIVVPPAGTDWVQTSTIEGTKVIDAWVKANEPAYFQEFGPPGPHVFVGFVRPFNEIPAPLPGNPITGTIQGQVVNQHLSRPPDYAFYDGVPFAHTTPWVGLNLGVGGGGIYAQRANADGTFTIPNVPPGSYQLVIWDDYLDLIFAFLGFTVNPNGTCSSPSGSCDFGNIPVFQWFARHQHYVFNDLNENGFWDVGEAPMDGQIVNLRWRDGTVYQSVGTDGEGYAPFDEIFPFFSWLVAEVDFTRYKATGVTVVADAGGPINPADPLSFEGVLNPQWQFCTAQDVADGICAQEGLPLINPNTLDNFSRTEIGPVLTQGFQSFLGQTSAFIWGKNKYEFGENGGISGIVHYATTRAEDDPQYYVAEVWEPGIPRVTVRLYDRTGTTLLMETQTDSWDDTPPRGCPGDMGDPFYLDGKCYDGMRNWNQVRPGVFDGGYAFMECYRVRGSGSCVAPGTAGAILAPLPTGRYVVEVIPPPGYEIAKEEDKNVDFGDVYTPAQAVAGAGAGAMAAAAGPLQAGVSAGGRPAIIPIAFPECVGSRAPRYPATVPQYLSLFPDQMIDAPFAGQPRPLCDRKLVTLSSGENAPANFFLFTEVPIAGHIVGFILDDTANEFDPASPQFGEKYAPPWLPVSIRDWTGTEISRTYSDQWGRYNALVPSTFTANLPQPSGMSPNMITACMNSPTLPDGTLDPFYNRQYSQFCYTFQYMPGTTTYLDTPVIPVAAFAGPDQFPLDCEFPNQTPMIQQVTVPSAGGGPYVTNPSQQIQIRSVGSISVPNPAYDGPGGTQPKTITRDYGFGTRGTGVNQGQVTINVNGTIRNLNINAWNNNQITAGLPNGTNPIPSGQYQLTVRRSNGRSTTMGVTLTVALGNGQPRRVSAGQKIQAAIDAAAPGELILVGPGNYDELVVMWKPVRLQGWGAPVTTINAVKAPGEKVQAWRDKIRYLLDPNGDGNTADSLVDLLPAQEVIFDANPAVEPATLFNEEGAGIIVLAKSTGPNVFGPNRSRIDGFTITGADHAGGIIVNGYANDLRIGNNRIISNSGFFGGGIRVGHPTLIEQTAGGLVYQDGFNGNIRIHNNKITQNGAINGTGGGGVTLCTGSESYSVNDNFICGNFTMGEGAGISHLGQSDGGRIERNTIIFNESFNQGTTVSGGGIFIGGGAPLVLGGLSEGSGTVTINRNLIQGNYAGAGDGGGIRAQYVNGQDIQASPNNPLPWHSLNIFNNIIANNVAGLAGGGISLENTVRANIIHNTITRNDSTATASLAFTPGVPTVSNPQPAGIVSRAHSSELYNAIGNGILVLSRFREPFSNPLLQDNIIWQNRSFYFFSDRTAFPPFSELRPIPNPNGTGAVFDDLGVLGTPTQEFLAPQYSILTSLTGTVRGIPYNYTGSGNLAQNPTFISGYFNGNRGQTIVQPEITTAMQAPAAFDEGGNFIKVRFGPLSQTCSSATGTLQPCSDYRIQNGSPAETSGVPYIQFLLLRTMYSELGTDYEGETRPIPSGARPDIGADERP